jgi:hypothetical protein
VTIIGGRALWGHLVTDGSGYSASIFERLDGEGLSGIRECRWSGEHEVHAKAWLKAYEEAQARDAATSRGEELSLLRRQAVAGERSAAEARNARILSTISLIVAVLALGVAALALRAP